MRTRTKGGEGAVAKVVGRVWRSKTSRITATTGLKQTSGLWERPGRTGGRAWLFKCLEINIGGRSLNPKTTTEKALGLAFIFVIPIYSTIPLRGTGCVCPAEVKTHVAECNPRMKKKKNTARSCAAFKTFLFINVLTD